MRGSSNKQMKQEEVRQTLTEALSEQMRTRLSGGIYHRTQVELTYNSNHMEGSQLTEEQTRLIFDTHTIGPTDVGLNVDDVIETVNHFRCVDLMITHYADELGEKLIKEFHYTLKRGTSQSQLSWFAVGDYKRLPNEVGGLETCQPEHVEEEMRQLLKAYNSHEKHTLEDILDFHARIERIHPFQDGNGRVGRLLMFKECLRSGIVPFIISDELKHYYYRGLNEWPRVKGYLIDTCLTAQDLYKQRLDYFGIAYS